MENNTDIAPEQGASEEGGEKAQKTPPKKKKKAAKRLIKLFIILGVLVIGWIAFSLIGRVDAAAVIPNSAVVRVTVHNPARFIDGLLAHESIEDISTVPMLASAAPAFEFLKTNQLIKNRFVRLGMRGKMEFALLPSDEDGTYAIAYDLKFLSPLLRLVPVISNFVNIPNLYYVQSGKHSRFEYRMENTTLFIGTYKNILYITDNSKVFESRLAADSEVLVFKNIKPSSYDAVVRLSHQYINDLFSEQNESIAEILANIDFESTVEAGLNILPKRIEFHLSAPLTSNQKSLSNFLVSRSQASDLAERLPASTQYATVLSAGTLEELYQAAIVFSGPALDDTLKLADASSRMLLGLTINDLLFSWSGKEYAVFGMEGRPHPVYAIQVNDERKRQEVFDKAFKSIFVNEDVRLSLDGTRIPRIEVPEFLQTLLRRWNIFLPSPYYTVYKDFILVSESAETLLSTLRAMQRNDVLPRTDNWRNLAGGKNAASAISLFYSLDRSMPFFLRKNTALSGYLSLYRQGLVQISFNRGVVDLSFSLIPGSGNGVSLVTGYPLDIGGRPANQLYGAGRGADARLFFASGNAAFSVDIADNSIYEISGQGTHWVIPADGTGDKTANVWVVSDRGRVTLADGNMEPLTGFPVVTGLRISSVPAAYEGKLYLCDEEGKVHTVDNKGKIDVWETVFFAALRSPPSFLTVPARGRNNPGGTFAAVYPKSFSGEIYLINNSNGSTMPNWPATIIFERQISESAHETAAWFTHPPISGSGIGFGSPVVFAHNNRTLTAFVCQTGELIIYDEEAKPVSPFPLFLDRIFYQQPVFDGTYLWLISEDGTLFRVSIEGEFLYQNIPDFTVKEEGYITVFDCDNDKIPEVFITGEGNALYAFTRNFRSLEGFPLPVWGRPYFTEMQSGKKPELFAIGMDRKLYRWQFR